MRGAAKSKNTPNSDRAGKKLRFFYSETGKDKKESFGFKVNGVFSLSPRALRRKK